LDLPKKIDDIDGAWIGAALHKAGRIAGPHGVVVKGVRRVGGGTAWSTVMSILDLEGPEGTPASAVVKLPIDGKLRQLLDGVGAYTRELTFYRDLARHVPVRVPEPYVAMMAEDSTDFVLIMEDLSHVKTPDQLVGLTVTQAEQAIDALADFHGWCWEHERLQQLEEHFPPLNSPQAMAINENFMSYFAQVWSSVRELPIVSDEVKLFGDRLPSLLPFFVERLSTPRTLSHGELRADNFFLLPEGGILLVDFQSLAQQAGMVDVAYLISQSVDEEVRRGRDETFVRRYHQRLVASGVADYSFEQAWEQYRLSVAFMLLMPGLAFIQAEQSDERGKQLMAEMLARANDTIMSVGSLDLLPSGE
jgi:thiamine kinase-like enzyme